MPEILRRINQIIETNLIEIKKDFKIYWSNYPVAKLQKGKDYLSPDIKLIIDDIARFHLIGKKFSFFNGFAFIILRFLFFIKSTLLAPRVKKNTSN